MVVRGDELLLVKRKSDPGRNLWSIPGGLVLLGERLTDAARREVKEETGLDVELTGLLGVFEVIRRDGEGRVEYHYVLVDYRGEVKGGDLAPGSDVGDAKWVKLSDVRSLPLTPTFSKLLEEIEKGGLVKKV